MKLNLMITFLLVSTALLAQEKEKNLSFDFGYGINCFKMDKLNEFYIDSFAAKPHVNILKDKITSGQHFRVGLSYKPKGLFDFGLYASYQYGNTSSSILGNELDFDTGMPIREVEGTFKFTTQAIGIGLSSTLYLSELLKFQEKASFIKNTHLGLEFTGGVGFSRAIADMRFPTLPISPLYDYLEGRDFQGQVGLKYEVDLVQSPLLTSIGLRFGYQFFRTKTLKDRIDRDWESLNSTPINLDFSGLYFGAYIKIAN